MNMRETNQSIGDESFQPFGNATEGFTQQRKYSVVPDWDGKAQTKHKVKDYIMERWDEDDGEAIVKGAGDTGLPLSIGLLKKGSMMNLTKYTKQTHKKDDAGEDLDKDLDKYIKNNI